MLWINIFQNPSHNVEEVGVSIKWAKYFCVFVKHRYSGYLIFPLCMKTNGLEVHTNNCVASKFFACWLVGFYDISTFLYYLIPNIVFKYLLDIWFINTFCWYTPLNDQTWLFLKIQFSINQRSYTTPIFARYH